MGKNDVAKANAEYTNKLCRGRKKLIFRSVPTVDLSTDKNDSKAYTVQKVKH